MSSFITSTSRMSHVGYKAVRCYAAAAPKIAEEYESLTSSEAGPSRRPSHPTPPGHRDHPLRIPLPVSDSAPIAKSALGDRPTRRASKPKGPAQQAAYRKAKAFAKALKATTQASDRPNTSPAPLSDPSSSSNPVTTSVEEPTVKDLIARKPRGKPPALANPSYPGRYQKLYESIDGAFVKQQLTPMARELGLRAAVKDSKWKTIPKIMAHWGWAPPLPDPHPRQARITKDFEMENADLFLLIRDERVLLDLTKNRNPTSFTIVPSLPATVQDQTGMPQSARSILRATGPEGSVNHLSRSLATRQSAKIVDTLTLDDLGGFRPSHTLLRALPALSESYIEMIDSDTIRFSANHGAKNKRAMSILHMAAMRSLPIPTNHNTAVIVPGPSSNTGPSRLSEDFTLSPFHTCPRDQLPWDVAASWPHSAMARLKRAVVWAAKPPRTGEAQREERIEEARIMWRSDANGEGEGESLGDLLRRNLDVARKDGDGESEQSVLVSFGHVLQPVSDPLSTQTVAIGKSTNPSIDIPEPDSAIFVPSSTPSMLQFPLESTSKRIRRLRYRCVDSGTDVVQHRQLVFTYEYPIQPEPVTEEEQDEEKIWQEELDAMMRKAELDVLEQDDPSDEAAELHVITGANVTAASPITSSETEMVSFAHNDGSQVESTNEGEAQKESPSSTAFETGYVPPFTSEVHDLSTTHLRFPDRPVDAHLFARSIVLMKSTRQLTDVRQFFRFVHEREHGISTRQFPPPAQFSMELNGRDQRFVLMVDEECEIQELDRGDGVTLRSVKQHEPGVEWSKPVTHTELECKGGEVPTMFWRTFADTARDVPANAGSLQNEIPAF